MTIRDAIARTDEQTPNAHSEEEKARWLSELDGQIVTEVIDPMGKDGVEIPSYTVESNMETELLIGAPYEEVYINWLEYKMAYADQEINKMNNASVLYNTTLDAFKRHYKRTHKRAHTPTFNYLH